MYKEPQKEKLAVEVFCDICGKPVADGKAKSDVTRYLLSESRCQCIHAASTEHAKTDSAKQAAHSQPTRTINLSLSSEHPDIWREKFNSALANLPAKYQFLSVLGEGGMGCVFKVLDTEQHSLVAVKMLRQQFVHNNDALQRFKQEAKSARNLVHPNIAKVIGYGVGVEGAPYLVMEFHEGQNLAEMIHGGHPLDPYQAVSLFVQVASAAEYAHNHNIIHRDIKPSNIIVERLENGDEVARLVDFGIAKTILAGPGVTHGLTQTGEIFGSPPYMPPEQCEGKELDRVSDVYAFGCVMYECLTGRTPFQAANPIRMILKHMDEIPVPVSTAAKHPVPEHLNDIVMRCLEKDREKRFPTMEQLRQELVLCLRSMPKPEHIDAPPLVSSKTQHTSYTMFIAPGNASGVDAHAGHLNAEDRQYLRQEYAKRCNDVHKHAEAVSFEPDVHKHAEKESFEPDVHKHAEKESFEPDVHKHAEKESFEPDVAAGIMSFFLTVVLIIVLVGKKGLLTQAFNSNYFTPPAVSQQVSAPWHPTEDVNARRIYNLASAYYQSGRYEDAATLGQFAFDGFEQSGERTAQTCAATLLSQCYEKMKQPQNADEFKDIAKKLQTQSGVTQSEVHPAR
jgi:serine/threonine protein kinase